MWLFFRGQFNTSSSSSSSESLGGGISSWKYVSIAKIMMKVNIAIKLPYCGTCVLYCWFVTMFVSTAFLSKAPAIASLLSGRTCKRASPRNSPLVKHPINFVMSWLDPSFGWRYGRYAKKATSANTMTLERILRVPVIKQYVINYLFFPALQNSHIETFLVLKPGNQGHLTLTFLRRTMEAEDRNGEWTKLPIYAHREQIVAKIHDNDVVVISGETGCGKTTQVPKYIIEEHPQSRIIVTQPRRLAAISVATRVAFELRCQLGGKVGYHIGMDCKATDKTKITYVTNGIFLQKLTNDPNFLSSYTHFIFDQIHERGMDCDFSLIAMKLYMFKRKHSKAKIILMSATLNSEMFSKFFAKNKTGQFILAKIIPEREEKDRRRERGRGNHREEQYEPGWKFKTELPITKDDEPAAKVELETKRKYHIDIKYLEDVEKTREHRMGFSEEPDLDDLLFETARRLMEKYVVQGDILTFVPGMKEIRKMSDLLSDVKSKYNVIELHSHYSQTAYEELFSKDPKPKIIISTNIAQSSITLPDCRTVIDFCMTKQNFYDERTRFQRLQLRWASKASLTQRAGRVGRVNDGTVIRLIPIKFLENLTQYDSPEMCRSPLEKIILQIKKLQLLDTMKRKGKQGIGSVFENPYQVLSNAFEPPEVEAMNSALERLVNQHALKQDLETMVDPEFNKMKYNGSSLKISKLGMFLVNMPCDLLIGKALLLAIELGCVNEMLDIAGIMYNKKPFFVSSEKRQKSQEFIHTIIDYDRENYNDFKLRQRILNSWKNKFFEPWKKDNWTKYITRKTLQTIDQEDENFYELMDGKVINYTKMLNDFQRIRAKKEQIEWCTLRCVYANNMREILVFRQGLKFKLLRGKFNFREIGLDNQIREMNVNICLFAAFKDNLMVIQRVSEQNNGKNSFENQGLKPQSSIDVDFDYEDHEKQISDYIYPEEGERKYVRMGNTFLFQTSRVILSKFMLPYKRKGKLNGNCNKVFKQLFFKQPYYPYIMRVQDLKSRTEARIDNESINGFIPHRGYYEGYLLTNGYFQNRAMVSTSCTCYLYPAQTILLLMIFAPGCELLHHTSHQFYNRIRANGYICKLPIFVSQKLIEAVAELKDYVERIFELESGEMVTDDLSEKFKAILTDHYDEIPIIQSQWEDIHLEKSYKKMQVDNTCVKNGIKYTPTTEQDDYHRKYDEWRREQLTLFSSFHSKLKYQNSYFICSGCYPVKITTLCDLSSCHPKDKLFSYHEYNDCWIVQGKEVICSQRKHRVGRQVNEDQVKLDSEDKVLIMHADLQIEKFQYARFDKEEMKKKEEQALQKIKAERKTIKVFECMFCGEDSYNFQSKTIQDFLKHARSKDHTKKIAKFSQGLIL